jgi:hypothetical protein
MVNIIQIAKASVSVACKNFVQPGVAENVFIGVPFDKIATIQQVFRLYHFFSLLLTDNELRILSRLKPKPSRELLSESDKLNETRIELNRNLKSEIRLRLVLAVVNPFSD